VDDGTNHTGINTMARGVVSHRVNGVVMRFIVDPSSADYQTLEDLSGTGTVTADYDYGLQRSG